MRSKKVKPTPAQRPRWPKRERNAVLWLHDELREIDAQIREIEQRQKRECYLDMRQRASRRRSN